MQEIFRERGVTCAALVAVLKSALLREGSQEYAEAEAEVLATRLAQVMHALHSEEASPVQLLRVVQEAEDATKKAAAALRKQKHTGSLPLPPYLLAGLPACYLAC